MSVDPAAYLDLQNSWPGVRESKRIMLEALRVGPGSRVLDAGCGPGDDTRKLASLVGPAGRAIGIDSNADMIHVARRRTADPGDTAVFLHGDMQDTGFADDTFDAVRSERAFQWLRDPTATLREFVRITRPGGRIVICDTDHATTVVGIGNPELNDALIHRAAMPGPRVARMLPRMLRMAGLTDLAVRAVLNEVDCTMARQMTDAGVDLFAALEGAGVSRDQLDEMRREADAALRSNTAFGVNTLIITSGTKPMPAGSG